MQNKMKIKKGDTVQVIAGRDKGKQGEVLAVTPKTRQVLVQGVALVKKHQKPTQTAAGGIVEKESKLHVSSVALLDPEDGKPCRVGYRFGADGVKERFSKRSGATLA